LRRGVGAERGNHGVVEKNSAGGGGVPFLKGGRRGGSGGGGGERGGARAQWGMAQQLVAAPAGGCGRRRCRETVEGDGVGVTRDDGTDRWAGTRQGPVKHSSI
jgi:hypothetical protein